MNLDPAAKLVGNGPIVEALVRGVSKDEFARIVAEQYPDKPLQELAVLRMNIIGGLRASGYTVSGGRAGGDEYKLLDFVPVRDGPKIQWSDDQKKLLEGFEKFSTVKSDHSPIYFGAAKQRRSGDLRHENSWLYTWCYELMGGRGNRVVGKWYDDGADVAIIKRTFRERPIFSIIDISLSVETLVHLIQTFSKISLKPVKVVNIGFDTAPYLLEALPGWIERVGQSMYDVRAIAQDPEPFFSKQSWKTAKKMLAETEWVEVAWDAPRVAEQTAVIDLWRARREGTQARPAVTRDYVASEMDDYTFKMSVLGIREGLPVSYRVIDAMPNNIKGACDIVEKSLNSSQDPGGHSGTSDASLVNICRLLAEKGFEYLNGGEALSVGPLLEKFKHKYASPDMKVSSMTWVSRGEYFKQ